MILLKEVEGFVISETAYGDSSKIINLLTREGLIGILCKGAKSLKSPIRSVCTKYTYGKYIIYDKKDKTSIMKEGSVILDFYNIKNDIILIGYMTYLSDLVYQVVKQNNSSLIYDNFISALKKIDEGMDPLIISNIFEIKMLDYLGVGINLNCCNNCGSTKNIVTINADLGGYICSFCYKGEYIYDAKTIKMIRMYKLVNIDTISDIKVNNNIKMEINRFLNIYYDRFTGLYLKSKKFLQELTNM